MPRIFGPDQETFDGFDNADLQWSIKLIGIPFAAYLLALMGLDEIKTKDIKAAQSFKSNGFAFFPLAWDLIRPCSVPSL